MHVKLVRRTGAAVAAAALALTTAGCTPTETWWPRQIVDPIVRDEGGPAVGDFDHDGLDDLLTYGAGSAREELWTARPEGGFDRVALPQVTGEYDPQVGDFDGDGDDDLLWLSRSGGTSTVWSFQAGAVVRRTTTAFPVWGGLPVVVERATGPDHVGVLVGGSPGRADGLYVKAPMQADLFAGDLLPASGNIRAATGDFDGDGNGDVVTLGTGADPDGLLWGRADGEYDIQALAAISGFYEPVALDADGDGRDDLAFYERRYPGPLPTTMTLWRGQAGRRFAKTTVTAPGVNGQALVQRDRADGREDLVVTSGDDTDVVWEMGADGRVVLHAITPIGWGGVAIGRFSDGVRDDVFVWGAQAGDRLLLSPRAAS